MPVKNTGLFLKECVESILAQTLYEWELIAIDDHSTDNSFEILDAFAHMDARIMVHRNKGVGIIAALREAYSYSTATFITRMDSDDIMSPEKLKKMSESLDAHGPGYIAIGLVQYFSSDQLGDGYQQYAQWLNSLTRTGTNFSDIYKECSIPSPCWMVARSDFDACGGFNHDTYPEDYDLALRFKKEGLKIAGIDEVLHFWRDYPSRTSRTHDHYSDNRFTALKVFHFLDQDRNSIKEMLLWGAGKKGKEIAKKLIKNKAQFRWISNNQKKVGRDIYGIILEDDVILNDLPDAQVIVAISSKKDKTRIEIAKAAMLNHSFFSFC